MSIIEHSEIISYKPNNNSIADLTITNISKENYDEKTINTLHNTLSHHKQHHTDIVSLLTQNEKLSQENKRLLSLINNTHNSSNINLNTSSSFFLISEIENIWSSIGNNDITDCFIDFYMFPDLLHKMIQQLLKEISFHIKSTIKKIINVFMKQCNIPLQNQTKFIYVSKSIRHIIKEFYMEIFEQESNNVYKKIKDSYMKYIQCNIFPKITRSLQEQFESDFKSNSFMVLCRNIQKILFFIEFNEGVDICINTAKKEYKRFSNKDCISVEGFHNENKNSLILIDTPKTIQGFVKYTQLKPIIIDFKNPNCSSQLELNFTETIQPNSMGIGLGCPIERENTDINDSCVHNKKNKNRKSKKLILTMRYLNTNSNINFNSINVINSQNLFKKRNCLNIQTHPNNNNNMKSLKKGNNNGGHNKQHKKKPHKLYSKTPQNEPCGLNNNNSNNNGIINISGSYGGNNINNNHVKNHSNKNINFNQNGFTHNAFGNNGLKMKHRSYLSINFTKACCNNKNTDEDINGKKSFSKFKEFIVNKYIKYKSNTNTLNNSKKKKSFERNVINTNQFQTQHERNLTNENLPSNHPISFAFSPTPIHSNKAFHLYGSPKSLH